jgi:hypothetical protein
MLTQLATQESAFARAGQPTASRCRPRRVTIASAMCVFLCGALAGMWVRSYQRWDEVSGRLGSRVAISVESIEGPTILIASRPVVDAGWRPAIDSRSIERSTRFPEQYVGDDCVSRLGLQADFWSMGSALVLPYWLLTLGSGWLAMVFGFGWPQWFDRRGVCAAIAFAAIVLEMSARLDGLWIGLAPAETQDDASAMLDAGPPIHLVGNGDLSEDCRPFVPCR